jgi:hypothetical protein
MMSRGIESFYFTAFMGLVVAGALFVAKDWPVRASIVILFLGSIGVILALAQLVADFKAVHAGAKPAERPTYETAALEHEGHWGSLEIWAWLWGLFLAIHLIGFQAALPIFVFLYTKFYGGTWLTAILLTAGTWGFLYGVFEEVLHVPWPEPWLKFLLPW